MCLLVVWRVSVRFDWNLQSTGSGGFQDNDSLASLLATELKAELLVLLTDVEGLYTGPPKDPASRYLLMRHSLPDSVTGQDYVSLSLSVTFVAISQYIHSGEQITNEV